LRESFAAYLSYEGGVKNNVATTLGFQREERGCCSFSHDRFRGKERRGSRRIESSCGATLKRRGNTLRARPTRRNMQKKGGDQSGWFISFGKKEDRPNLE